MFYSDFDQCMGCTAEYGGHMNTKSHYCHHSKDLQVTNNAENEGKKLYEKERKNWFSKNADKKKRLNQDMQPKIHTHTAHTESSTKFCSLLPSNRTQLHENIKRRRG